MPRGRRAAAAGGAGVSALAALDPNDNNSGLVLASDDEDLDESYMASAAPRKGSVGSSKKKRHFLSASDDEDADESYMAPLRDADSSDEENSQQTNAATKKKSSAPAPRRSVGRKSIGGGANANNNKKKKGGAKSRRRRSSARFLRLSGRFDAAGGEDGADGSSSPAPLDRENLGEVYRQAIRMNAENKINAGNSWGLKLIENMDKLVHGDDDGGAAGGGAGASGGGGGATGVNFTKASCTLDASVKIYGYRVDDVHLTSYKVLHNLNRTDAGGGKKGRDADGEDGGMDGDDSDAEDGAGGRTRRQKRGGGTADTLESNLANINMSKLDSAPDIDPLFRKMSKAFDEGGAKGLLLNNLGVARDGCRIEFDSKEDTVTENVVAPSSEEEEGALETIEEEEKEEEAEESSSTAADNREEGMIDITGLVTKLREVLNGSSLESLPFVPQLEVLRADFAALEADGFADDGKKGRRPASRPARYGVTDEDEKEAERSIHMEAIERSHRSTANVSFAGGLGGADDEHNDGDDDNGPIMFGDDDDFGGGGDDDFDDDDDDAVFTNFLAMDTNAEKYSAVEFQSQGDGAGGSDGILPTTAMRTRTTTTALLDAICSSDALIAGGEFEYFDSDTLDKITKGNMWAGSEHWKKSDKIRSKKQKEAAATKKPSARKKRASTKERAFVDLTCSSTSCLDALINDKPKPKGKSKNDPLLLTKAVLSKQENNDNLLPPDAGVGIEQLSKLFMRPDAAVQPRKTFADGSSDLPRKSVGFLDMGPTIFDDGDDSSFGGCDDDGPGFQLADDDSASFVVEELEGVRKVNKVNIGYATVAKKVDVKRLKKDLWNNIETKTTVKPEEKATENDAEEGGDISVDKDNQEDDAPVEEKVEEKEGAISFQDTVKELAASQGQSEVTLPFYFICVLHLCNEKGLYLDQAGDDLTDFIISRDDGSAPTFGTMPESVETAKPRRQRGGAKKTYEEEAGSDEESEEAMSEEGD